MLNRWIGIILAALMLVANAVIVFRDVIPDMFIGDPPKSMGTQLAVGEELKVQVGIYDSAGRLLGRSWTECHRRGDVVTAISNTVLEPMVLPNGIATPRVRIGTQLTYQMPDARVDELEFIMNGIPELPVSLKGEHLPSNEFPCSWTIGQESGRFIIPSELTRALGDAVKPFDRLPELYVGRTWQVKLLNPVALLTRSFQPEQNLEMQTIVVRCTGKETIAHDGRDVDAFVVEAHGVRAWALHDGRVVRQEVNLPFLGLLVLKDEPYKQPERDKAIKSVPSSR